MFFIKEEAWRMPNVMIVSSREAEKLFIGPLSGFIGCNKNL
jgi:hypothetical protein